MYCVDQRKAVGAVLHGDAGGWYLPVREEVEKEAINGEHADGFRPKRWVIWVPDHWAAAAPENASIRGDNHAVASVVFELAMRDCSAIASHV